MKYHFPQYRKLSNGKSYYRVDSAELLTEIQRTGSRWTVFELRARILPERTLISDILENHGGHYPVIDAAAFDAFRRDCEAHLIRY